MSYEEGVRVVSVLDKQAWQQDTAQVHGWMAALRLTKAESCGVDYDDELAPVKPPASFHASHANTNTLGCRAHYSGTAQPHLFFRLHLCLLGIFCMRFLSCVNI